MKFVDPSPSNDIYFRIPDPLLDAVLESAMERTMTFYEQTFWCNNDVFLCNQAAQKLVKAGKNVDRAFMGESPGGTGQSLYSGHLAAQCVHNYFSLTQTHLGSLFT